MAKIKTEPLTSDDLESFLNDRSDFAFELRVQQQLIAAGFQCEHGGTYDDPVTKKPRQFDLRASKSNGRCDIRLAVECKNLQSYFPLLISCVPRLPEECFHEILLITRLGDLGEPPQDPIRLSGVKSIYQPSGVTGKASDRVGRNHQGDFISDDSEVYERWAQAIGSSHELVERAYNTSVEQGEIRLVFVLPVLVVPDGSLWTVTYDATGNRVAPPTPVRRCSYFVGKTFNVRIGIHWMDYTVSHLEFVTIGGIPELLEEVISPGSHGAGVFNVNEVTVIRGGSKI